MDISIPAELEPFLLSYLKRLHWQCAASVSFGESCSPLLQNNREEGLSSTRDIATPRKSAFCSLFEFLQQGLLA